MLLSGVKIPSMRAPLRMPMMRARSSHFGGNAKGDGNAKRYANAFFRRCDFPLGGLPRYARLRASRGRSDEGAERSDSSVALRDPGLRSGRYRSRHCARGLPGPSGDTFCHPALLPVLDGIRRYPRKSRIPKGLNQDKLRGGLPIMGLLKTRQDAAGSSEYRRAGGDGLGEPIFYRPGT